MGKGGCLTEKRDSPFACLFQHFDDRLSGWPQPPAFAWRMIPGEPLLCFPVSLREPFPKGSDRTSLLQGMNILYQIRTVIVGFRAGKDEIRFNSLINIVEGTVQHSRHLLGAGKPEHRAGSGGAGQHDAGAAAGTPSMLTSA